MKIMTTITTTGDIIETTVTPKSGKPVPSILKHKSLFGGKEHFSKG